MVYQRDEDHSLANSSLEDDSETSDGHEASEFRSSQKNWRPDEFKQMEEFASKETRRVNVFRFFVVLSILVIGGAVSILTFFALQSQIVHESKDAVSISTTA